ncbi:MAG TPA: methyltransferase [Candidatus Angelobacter sp.]|nr:methyltransferase [Candidatus Angelobacter sp.]
MSRNQKPHRVARARLFSLASAIAFLIAVSEMVFMASPFAAYFYSVYSPVLTWTESHSFLIWLTDFFVPHLSTPRSAWLGSVLRLPRYLLFVGLASFVVHAAYLYWTKFVKKTVATALLYRYVRHPQYLSFAVAGLGLVFLWPRFINLLLFFVMLISYYALARAEEERMLRLHGEQYLLYQQRTAMFIPGRIGGRIAEVIFGRLPSSSMRSYAALALLLVVGLSGSFLVRAASVKNLHTVALPNALLVFLEEPAGVSQSEIESEITRVLADHPARERSVPLFYVLSSKGALHHLLLDSGIRQDATTRSKLPDASWYLVGASASYCASST